MPSLHPPISRCTALRSNALMSREDQNRWDERFAAGAYGERTHPSVLVESWAPSKGGHALDVAAGAGRNSDFLARHGFEVLALDVSVVGLERARESNHEIRTVHWDLDDGLPEVLGLYDLIVVVRYLNLRLMPDLIEHLAPGGRLIAEVLLRSEEGVGPRGGRFRAAPGELSAACSSLRCLHAYEGSVIDPDGRTAYVAQFVGDSKVP